MLISGSVLSLIVSKHHFGQKHTDVKKGTLKRFKLENQNLNRAIQFSLDILMVHCKKMKFSRNFSGKITFSQLIL